MRSANGGARLPLLCLTTQAFFDHQRAPELAQGSLILRPQVGLLLDPAPVRETKQIAREDRQVAHQLQGAVDVTSSLNMKFVQAVVDEEVGNAVNLCVLEDLGLQG